MDKSDYHNNENEAWKRLNGKKMPFLPEHYAGPKGIVAVLVYDFIPEGLFMFVKDGVLVDSWIPEKDATGQYQPDMNLLLNGGIDAMICNPKNNPRNMLSPEAFAEMQADVKRSFQ